MSIELQPTLENAVVRLRPLEAEDFEPLFAVASDPLIWEQHPDKLRYQRPVFQAYFDSAIASRGAFCVFDAATGELIGSSRFYDVDAAAHCLTIGYTFIARSVWGRPHNRALKTLMLNHAFRYVDRVLFAVGKHNLRSRRAMEKLGGILLTEEAVSYGSEPAHPNIIYKIDKVDWNAATSAARLTP